MLAIVIPYYNATYFEKTLDSLSNQTNKNFKVYIGNDNSLENPEPVLHKFKDKFNFEYFKFETNLGSISLTKQWERCLNKIQDETWFIILGDDDFLEDNVVESFYLNLQNLSHNFAVLRYSTVLVDESNNHLTEKFTHPKTEKSTDFLVRKIKGKTRSSLSEYVFKKEIYLKRKFYNFPLAWYSDDLAVLESSNFGEILSINNATVYIRISSTSISGNKENENSKTQASLQFYILILNKYHNKFTKSQIKVILERGERFYFKKMYFKESLFFFKFHIINQGVISTLKFLRRIVINYKFNE